MGCKHSARGVEAPGHEGSGNGFGTAGRPRLASKAEFNSERTGMDQDIPMRIAVFSDTHGNRRDMREAVLSFLPLDLIIHLGDGVRDGIRVALEATIPFHGVRGNEDYGTDLPDVVLVEAEGWRLLLTHGHQMSINPYHPKDVWEQDLRDMAAWAKGKRAEALLFGHAHTPVLQRENGIVLCNPGDQYIGSAAGPSFAFIEAEAAAIRFRIFRKSPNGDWGLLAELGQERTGMDA